MSANQVVEFVTTKAETVAFDRPDAFSFRKDRPHHWLQRACLFVLRKLGAFDVGKRIEYTRHTLKPTDLLEAIRRQRGEFLNVSRKPPTRLLIGAVDYEELMGSEAIRNAITFTAPLSLSTPQGTTIYGLTIEIIPWMRGILVMP